MHIGLDIFADEADLHLAGTASYLRRGRLLKSVALDDLALVLDDAIRKWDAQPFERRESQFANDVIAEYAIRALGPSFAQVQVEWDRLALGARLSIAPVAGAS